MSTEFGVCEVPDIHHGWEEPLPTAKSWKAAYDINIRHVRMSYRPDRIRFFDPAFRLARDGGMHITANMGVEDLDAAAPDVIEAAAFEMVLHYGSDIESVSFENEPGGKLGMSPQAAILDISQGGTFDWIANVYGPLFRAFVAGARRAKPGVIIDAFDADSTDVQERCMALVEGDNGAYRWCFHNYADIEVLTIGGGQDYSSMAGMNGKPGFLSVVDADPHHRDWYVSEIGKTTGPWGGIATPSDMQVMIRYTRMMLGKYPQCRKIDFGSAKYFFERVPVWSARQPDLGKPDADTWCSWTFGEPIVSAQGREIAGLFKATMPVGRKRAVCGE